MVVEYGLRILVIDTDLQTNASEVLKELENNSTTQSVPKADKPMSKERIIESNKRVSQGDAFWSVD